MGAITHGFSHGSTYRYPWVLPTHARLYAAFINHPDISCQSRRLNLIFSFASLETTANFSVVRHGFFAIQGKIYHCIRPTHKNSVVWWLLYDGFDLASVPHQGEAAHLLQAWLRALQVALVGCNPFVLSLRVLGQLSPQLCPNAHIILEDTGTSPEIAALMSYENTMQAEVTARRLIIQRTDDQKRTIPTVSCLWKPLAYPFFFPHGTLGWGVFGQPADILNGAEHNVPYGSQQTNTQMWHYRARLLREPRFQIFGRLANEYIVNMWTRNLASGREHLPEGLLEKHQFALENAGNNQGNISICSTGA